MLSKQADKLLDSLVKDAKKNLNNGVTRSRIVDHLILNSDPLKMLKINAKDLAIELNIAQNRIKTLKEISKEK